jgi:predicted N-acetyltransferase YhbS
MITIRQAEHKDIEGIVRLLMEFHEESVKEFGYSFDPKTLRTTSGMFIDNYIAMVACDDNVIIGVIAGVLIASMYDMKQQVASEIVWYVDKRYKQGSTGLKLAKRYEDECRERGADIITMGCFHGKNLDILDRYYTSRNFKPMEYQYVKGV